jgi:hypothetical protein
MQGRRGKKRNDFTQARSGDLVCVCVCVLDSCDNQLPRYTMKPYFPGGFSGGEEENKFDKEGRPAEISVVGDDKGGFVEMVRTPRSPPEDRPVGSLMRYVAVQDVDRLGLLVTYLIHWTTYSQPPPPRLGIAAFFGLTPPNNSKSNWSCKADRAGKADIISVSL